MLYGIYRIVPQFHWRRPVPDPAMPAAFRACLTADTFTAADRAAVGAHDSVAYLLSASMDPDAAVDVSRRMLAVTAALLRHSATAAKNESSGLAHGRDRWLALADAAAADRTRTGPPEPCTAPG